MILAADHGEEFDEHGGRYHGSTLFDEQVRVPLIIAVPGLAPRVVQSPVELVDVAPTVLGLLDLPVPAAHARHRPRAVAEHARPTRRRCPRRSRRCATSAWWSTAPTS